MNYAGNLIFEATVQHRLCRADGSFVDYAPDTRILIKRPIAYWRAMWEKLRHTIPFFATMSFACFVEYVLWRPQAGAFLVQLTKGLPLMGIVTSAGINYLATTFTNNTNPLINFNYHSYGTGDVHGATNAITSATNATPIVVTRNGHGFGANDIVKISGGTGMTNINAIWQISPVTTNTYTLLGSVGNGVLAGSPIDQLLNGQGDTALTTEAASLTRVAGTQSNPTSNQYKTIATVPFTGTTPPLTIIEWALFSASSAGTMWDRRWLNTANSPSTTASASLTAAPITITQTSDSIQTSYTLTTTAGGS